MSTRSCRLPEELNGAVVKTALYKGEPVMAQKIVIKGEQGLLSAMMNPDMRAVSIEISAESASGGFVLPNDRVDLILTYDQRSQPERGIPERTVANTIIQNVRVLAIDQNFAVNAEGETARLGSTATIEVTPREAELVAMAQRLGQVTLSLRPLDTFVSGTERKPRTDMLEGSGSESGITIFRNGQPVAASVGGTSHAYTELSRLHRDTGTGTCAYNGRADCSERHGYGHQGVR